MPHGAHLIHRTRMTVPQQTMQVLRQAATRTSRRRKSSVWRTSMWAVADGQLGSTFQLRLFSNDHTSPQFHADVVYFAFGWVSFVYNMDCRFRLSRSVVARFMGLAAPIRYTLMGLPLRFSFSRAHVLCSCACCANPVVTWPSSCCQSSLCPSVLARLHARRVSIDPSHTLNLAEVTRLMVRLHSYS